VGYTQITRGQIAVDVSFTHFHAGQREHRAANQQYTFFGYFLPVACSCLTRREILRQSRSRPGPWNVYYPFCSNALGVSATLVFGRFSNDAFYQKRAFSPPLSVDKVYRPTIWFKIEQINNIRDNNYCLSACDLIPCSSFLHAGGCARVLSLYSFPFLVRESQPLLSAEICQPFPVMV
jgi:hypothetical protein